MSLPVELELDPGLRRDDDLPYAAPAILVTPAQAGARFISLLRNFVSRVTGRLEAARP